MEGSKMAGAKPKSTGKQVGQVLFCSLFLLGSPAALGGGRPGAASTPARQTHSSLALRSMARVYMACGDYQKAQPLLETALSQAQATNVSDSELCACLIDSAYLYKEQGNLSQAETICRLGLALQEKIHHANHPYVADTLRILSEIRRGQGRYEEAESTLARAIAIIRKARPEDGQEVAPFKVDMARLLTARGDYANAESYFREAIDVIDKSFGPEHLYTAKVRCSLATLYSLQGRNAEAETLISRALPIYEKIHGPDHHFLIPLWLVKARINQTTGRTAEAQALLDKSLRVARKGTDCGRLIQGEVLSELGQFYLQNRQFSKAQNALLQAVEMFESSQAVESAAALHALARVYVEKSKYSEAQNLCRRALNVLEGISDQAHPQTADVLETLVQLNRRSGNANEVARLEQRVEEIRVLKPAAYAPAEKSIQ
jgi:tetratricopeptide (TPR) repeat protein